MTPDEAVKQFAELRLLPPGSDYVRSAVLDVLRAVTSTAKAEETRRCAARVRDLGMRRNLIGTAHIANDLLVSGGLKVGE